MENTVKLASISTAMTFVAIGGKALMKWSPRVGATITIASYAVAGVMAVGAMVCALREV